jgi:hypothetical protein
MVISFNTNGLQPISVGGIDGWEDPRTGDRAAVTVTEGRPFPGEWLHDPHALRKGFAGFWAKDACLIEVEQLSLGGVTAVRQLVKVPLKDARHGQRFLSIFTLAKCPVYAQLMYTANEHGITGIRESRLVAELGHEGFFMPHPFDPQLRTGLPFHRGDDPAYDHMFPDHPLSRARAWAWNVGRYATVDPRFAALPDNWNP